MQKTGDQSARRRIVSVRTDDKPTGRRRKRVGRRWKIFRLVKLNRLENKEKCTSMRCIYLDQTVRICIQYLFISPRLPLIMPAKQGLIKLFITVEKLFGVVLYICLRMVKESL